MGLLKEFKDFAMRGNVVDMAIGIVIGAAFTKIVGSFVGDLLMPPLGLVTGGVDFGDQKLTLKSAAVDAQGAETAAVTLNYGMFINVVIDFLIVAFAVFLLVKLMNAAKRKEPAPPPPPPPPPTAEVKLLTEIRDLLRASA
jgi:large conductance mechanosensitive channel